MTLPTVEQWLNNNPISIKIWQTKYRNGDETLENWLNRVSGYNPKIRQLILDKKFLFGGRTLANRGLDNGSYANCYSHGFVPDTLEDIMKVNSDLALTYRAHGGQGISLSKIRPKGTPIGKRFTSDGIVPFMKLFNQTTETISQGGSRKGALMMSCDVWHKQIKDFITIKSEEGAIEKANLSVEIDDVFMNMVDHYLKTGEHPTKHIVKDYNGHTIEYDVDVAEIFELICKNACEHAEPGIIFTEKFRNYNLMQYVPEYTIETCNPCGEQPLPNNGACNLCSINLYKYVKDPFTPKASMNWNELRSDLFIIIGAMDDLIDENLPNHATKEQAEMSKRFRNIGIGFMGFADMLIALGLKYDTDQAIKMAYKVAKFMFKTSIYASVELADYRGSFPGYDPMIWKSEIIRANFTDEEIIELSKHNRLRNCSLISIAPTGSLSTMLNIGGGIEPLFQINEFVRKTQIEGEWKDYLICPQVVTDYRNYLGRNISIEELPEFFVSAADLDPYRRIEMQGTVQKCVDTAISSTLNLPKSTTVEMVKAIYHQAWLRGLKGVTIYVDGSRDPVLRSKNSSENRPSDNRVIPHRPKILEGRLFRTKANGEDFYIILGLLDNKPYEMFIVPTDNNGVSEATGTIVKVASRHYTFEGKGFDNGNPIEIKLENIAIENDDNPTIYNLSMLVSGLLRHTMPIPSIIKLLNKCNPVITSPHRAMVKVLKHYDKTSNDGDTCPICGGKLIYENGCKHCENGDWSACFVTYIIDETY